jgi:cyclopropane fatty-acyl-phospholipid synthase-like methyltransferase
MCTLISTFLRSPLVWRLTGLSYSSAVLATRGSLLTVSDYLAQSAAQMKPLEGLLRGKRVVEFGCGIGGNLMAVSPIILDGIGLDVNRGFVKIGNRLMESHKCSNVRLMSYNGSRIPSIKGVDAFYSIGVFERLQPSWVRSYVRQLSELSDPGTVLLLYFLTSRATDTPFLARLGREAYHFWTSEELGELFSGVGLMTRRVLRWPSVSDRSVSVADMYELVKT